MQGGIIISCIELSVRKFPDVFWGTVPLHSLIGFIVTSLMLLVRYRQGDANIRSAWLCTRNDVLANISVIVAGLLVLASGSHWPDVLVAMGV